jgi:nicotinate-nucleotide--dimethylbenzimidazole phosphoribosyltransferase
MYARKVAVVEAALTRTARQVPSGDHLGALASLGGLEIAALAGFIVGAAAAAVPVIVDGVIAAAALITAATMCPAVLDYSVAGHRSAEPGSQAALAYLGLRPLLTLDLRLGEGTGACLALPLVQVAARVLQEMSTFDQAGVSSKDV